MQKVQHSQYILLFFYLYLVSITSLYVPGNPNGVIMSMGNNIGTFLSVFVFEGVDAVHFNHY